MLRFLLVNFSGPKKSLSTPTDCFKRLLYLQITQNNSARAPLHTPQMHVAHEKGRDLSRPFARARAPMPWLRPRIKWVY